MGQRLLTRMQGITGTTNITSVSSPHVGSTAPSIPVCPHTYRTHHRPRPRPRLPTTFSNKNDVTSHHAPQRNKVLSYSHDVSNSVPGLTLQTARLLSTDTFYRTSLSQETQSLSL